MEAAMIAAYASVGALTVSLITLCAAVWKIPFEIRSTWYKESDAINDFFWKNPEMYAALFLPDQAATPDDEPRTLINLAKTQIACMILLDGLERIALAIEDNDDKAARIWRNYIRKFYETSSPLRKYFLDNTGSYTFTLALAFGIGRERSQTAGLPASTLPISQANQSSDELSPPPSTR